MVRVGKSLPASKALSIPTLLHKLDCMQFNCIQSFFDVLGEGSFREGTGRIQGGFREDSGRIQLKMRRNFSVRSFFFPIKKNERTPEQLTTLCHSERSEESLN